MRRLTKEAARHATTVSYLEFELEDSERNREEQKRCLEDEMKNTLEAVKASQEERLAIKNAFKNKSSGCVPRLPQRERRGPSPRALTDDARHSFCNVARAGCGQSRSPRSPRYGRLARARSGR